MNQLRIQSLEKGPDMTLRDYLYECSEYHVYAKRDPDTGRFVPDKVGTYYRDKIGRIERELEEARSKTLTEVQRELREGYNYQVAYERRREEELEEKKALLQGLLVKVHAWVPPTTKHEKLKADAISRLEYQIEHETRFFGIPLTKPEDELPAAVLAEEIEQLEGELARARLELKREEQRVAKKNAWIEALESSLPNA